MEEIEGVSLEERRRLEAIRIACEQNKEATARHLVTEAKVIYDWLAGKSDEAQQ